MSLRWTDVHEIAIALAESEADIDPLRINFPDLRKLIMALPEFADRPDRCGEKILEAIQMAWYEEYQDVKD